MQTTTSHDGTTIAYERVGDGPTIVVAAGALCDRTSFADLTERLAPAFTVVNYDRRGRGDSGDSAPYAPAREVDDLAAVIEATGDEAFVFGHSSGAILTLEAAAAGVRMAKLVAYEPPYVEREAPGLLEEVQALVACGRRDEAVSAFIVYTGMPPEFLPMIQASPMWATMVGAADTIWHDLTIVGDGTVPADRMAAITVPTLIGDGGESAEEMHIGAKTIAGVVPGARTLTVPGQNHNIAPDELATLLTDFFA